MDIISAISTAPLASGVAVIRLSGDGALEIAKKMFFPSGKTKVEDFEPYKLYVGEIDGGSFRDYGMCVFFRAPKSYTGEDMVEFHSHGGIAITRGILSKTLELGARIASRGEYTRRAFLNGKLSLSSCEGLIDMIYSESLSEVRAGYNLYREKLTRQVNSLQDRLMEMLSLIDAGIDFPEEEVPEADRTEIALGVKAVSNEIEKLLASYKTGRVVKSGVSVALVGRTNTGKSSILNALLGYDKAIVSDISGTTRDVVEGSIDISGIRFNLFDTAGIREADDKIESMGIERSKKTLAASDIALFIVDGSRGFTEEDRTLYNSVKDKEHLVVVNKTDLEQIKLPISGDICVSAIRNENIEQLKQAIYDKAFSDKIDLSGEYLTEERHYLALSRALTALQSIENGRELPLDLYAIDIKEAWDALGEISGKTASEGIIDEIFSRFCVGK